MQSGMRGGKRPLEGTSGQRMPMQQVTSITLRTKLYLDRRVCACACMLVCIYKSRAVYLLSQYTEVSEMIIHFVRDSLGFPPRPLWVSGPTLGTAVLDNLNVTYVTD